jgi:hypothetical protein
MKIDRKRVYEKFNGHCAYCGTEIEYKDMQVDHLIPKQLGYGNLDDFSNLMPSCRTCNHYKRGYFLENYRNLLRTIHNRLQKIYIFRVALKYGIVDIKPFNGVFYFEKITYKYQSICARLDLALNNNPEIKLHCSRIGKRRKKIKSRAATM